MNNINNLNEIANHILNIAQNGNANYIFGTGWMGTKFLEVMKALRVNISGFVISKQDLQKDSHLGIDLYEIQEFSNRSENKNIFVALRDQDNNLNKKLSEKFHIVFPIEYPGSLAAIEAKFYFNYFDARGIDYENEEQLLLDEYKLVNPFFKNYDYLLSWVYEAGDLLLPEMFNDRTRVDEGSYEEENAVLAMGDTVIDCGANIGLFSSVAAKKGCYIYAFEPMPEAIDYLKEVEKNFPNQIKICPYALSNKRGKAFFHVQNNDLLGASLLENNNVIDKNYEVTLETIDDFVSDNNIKRVDYIKADIEGAEREMLKGAEHTIKRFMPKISICTYHLEDDKEVLENILKSFNPAYVITHKWKKMYAYIPKEEK